MRSSTRGDVDPFIVMDVMEAARQAEAAGRHIIHMEVGQPGTGKTLLRDLLYKHVPQNLFSVNKQGFNIPIADWLRGPLKIWAEDLITSCDTPHINKTQALHLWAEHQSSNADHSSVLWKLLMLLAWLDHWHTA